MSEMGRQARRLLRWLPDRRTPLGLVAEKLFRLATTVRELAGFSAEWRGSGLTEAERSANLDVGVHGHIADAKHCRVSDIATWTLRSMNFRDFAMPFLAAAVLAVFVWAVLGPPPPAHSWIANRHFAGPP